MRAEFAFETMLTLIIVFAKNGSFHNILKNLVSFLVG